MSVQSRLQHHMMPRLGKLGDLNLGLEYSFSKKTSKKIAFLNRTRYGNDFWYHATMANGSIKIFNSTNLPEEVMFKENITLIKIVPFRSNLIALTSGGKMWTKSSVATHYSKISLDSIEEKVSAIDFLILGRELVVLTSKQEIITMELEFKSDRQQNCYEQKFGPIRVHKPELDIQKMVSLDDKVYFLDSNGKLIQWTFETVNDDLISKTHELKEINVYGERVKDVASSLHHLLVLTEERHLYTLEFGNASLKELQCVVDGQVIKIKELHSTDQVVITVSEDNYLYPLECHAGGDMFVFLQKQLTESTIIRYPYLRNRIETFSRIQINVTSLPYQKIIMSLGPSFDNNKIDIRFTGSQELNVWEKRDLLQNEAPKLPHQIEVKINQVYQQNEWPLDPMQYENVANLKDYLNTTLNRSDLRTELSDFWKLLLRSGDGDFYMEKALNEYKFRDSKTKISNMIDLFINDPDLEKASLPFPVAINCNNLIKRLLDLSLEEFSQLSYSQYKIIPAMLKESSFNLEKMVNLMRPNCDGTNQIISKLKQMLNDPCFSNFSLKVVQFDDGNQNKILQWGLIHVNSTYLSIVSSHMELVFYNHWPKNVGDTQVLIYGHDYSTYYDYIYYLYTGDTETCDNTPGILDIAFSYLDEDLLRFCVDKLFAIITPEKCIVYYQLIDCYSLDKFELMVDEYISNKILAEIEIPNEVHNRFFKSKLRTGDEIEYPENNNMNSNGD